MVKYWVSYVQNNQIDHTLTILDDLGLILKLTGTGICTCTWVKTHQKHMGYPYPDPSLGLDHPLSAGLWRAQKANGYFSAIVVLPMTTYAVQNFR